MVEFPGKIVPAGRVGSKARLFSTKFAEPVCKSVALAKGVLKSAKIDKPVVKSVKAY